MIDDEISKITAQLDNIEQRYLNADPGGYDASIFSLVYILLLSSWLEECRNRLSFYLVDAFFEADADTDKIKQRLEKINGIKFSEHFRKAIELVIGVHGYQELRADCQPQTLASFESAIGFVWSARCEAAHNTFEGLQNRRFRAPSTIKSRCNDIFNGLKDLENSINALTRNRVKYGSDK